MKRLPEEATLLLPGGNSGARSVVSRSVCAVCGQPLGGSAACLACLLRAGLGEAEATHETALTFSDFEIVRREDGSLCELGRGAMGVTYRARDHVLEREVALKVIELHSANGDAHAVRERFLREARAAAALRHPNIAAVFQFGVSPDGGQCYCAMELVEGETLEATVRRTGPISVDLALEIGVQVAGALIAAAERGLVHRDLKPGNIMLAKVAQASSLPDSGTSNLEGRATIKVIDFGLAKAINAAAEMELTHGNFVGTPAFASPEQFRGEAVDARSDIYALGVTLWFALTGRLPTSGTTIEEIRRRQAERKLPLEQLEARSVPRSLINLLRACLALDPAERPASARELLRAFEECRAQRANARRGWRRLALAAALCVVAAAGLLLLQPKKPVPTLRPIEKGVAVLPFENLSAAPEDAFFASGLQDDVLTSLGKIKDLKVIARSSVMEYRDAHAAGKLPELAHSLGVSHALQGTVRRTGERMVLNVSLIDAREERQVWTERYERSLSDATALQGELALEIARALRATLSPAEQTLASLKPTQNPEAYLAYLRGRENEITISGGGQKWSEAIAEYQRAIDLDPGFALARARLSICASNLFYETGDPTARAQAQAEAEEALRLRPDLGEAHLAMACRYLFLESDLVRARASLDRAVELLPNSGEAAMLEAFVYKRQNKMRERIAALQRADILDPRSGVIQSILIRTYRWVRDWPEAIRAFDRRKVVGPGKVESVARVARALDEFRLTGQLEVLRSALAEDIKTGVLAGPDVLHARFEIAMLERDFSTAAAIMREMPDTPQAPLLGSYDPHWRAFQEALLEVARGSESAVSRAALEKAGAAARVSITADPVHSPNWRARADLAIVEALLGHKEEAVAQVLRARDSTLLPNCIEYHDMSAALALVYARTGEPEKALDLIEHLLTVPVELDFGTVYNMTLTELKWRWIWDPLRSHPRFQRLLAGPEPKTVY